MNTANPFYQINCSLFELKRIVNHRKHRWLTCWFSPGTQVIISYRIDRFGYLIFKRFWVIFRLALLPLFISSRLLGGDHEIHYKADLGKGLMILHPGLGVVVSGSTIAGENLTLTGGNCIGIRQSVNKGDLVLGDGVYLGANAVVLGPVKIGNRVIVGAGAVVIHDAPDHAILVGVPARIKNQDIENDHVN